MVNIPKPVVPPVEIPMATKDQVLALLKSCEGRDPLARRDYANIAIMLDTGLRLSEVVNLNLDDISDDFSLRVFGKGRKWRTVSLGATSSRALQRWLRIRKSQDNRVWTGRKGPPDRQWTATDAPPSKRCSRISGAPHMLRHCFVDNWLRSGGSEADLSRIGGWTTPRMADRYARHRANERALTAQRALALLDSMTKR